MKECNKRMVISKRLGHSKINTTLDVYGHLFKDADKKAADIMEGVLNVESVQNKKSVQNLSSQKIK